MPKRASTQLGQISGLKKVYTESYLTCFFPAEKQALVSTGLLTDGGLMTRLACFEILQHHFQVCHSAEVQVNRTGGFRLREHDD